MKNCKSITFIFLFLILFSSPQIWAHPSVKDQPQTFFQHMADITKDFAFHVYPTRKNADLIIQIDFNHHYSILHNEDKKVRLEPDFTAFRLETITY